MQAVQRSCTWASRTVPAARRAQAASPHTSGPVGLLCVPVTLSSAHLCCEPDENTSLLEGKRWRVSRFRNRAFDPGRSQRDGKQTQSDSSSSGQQGPPAITGLCFPAPRHRSPDSACGVTALAVLRGTTSADKFGVICWFMGTCIS